MKPPTSSFRRLHRGFTLIELLVVIVIIAILVSLAVPTYNLVMAKANAMRTKSAMQSIIAGVGHYQTEYNRYPMDPSQAGGAGDEDREGFLTDGTDGSKNPISILMARTDDAPPNMNSRKIKFVDLPQARNGLFGVVDPSGGSPADPAELQLMDIWGRPYTIRFDTNYDNSIENPDKENLDQTIQTRATDFLTARAVMFSNGPDKTAQTKDDITSWR